MDFVDKEKLKEKVKDESSVAFWGLLLPDGTLWGDRIEVRENIAEKSKDRLVKMFDILRESAVKTIKKLVKEKENENK